MILLINDYFSLHLPMIIGEDLFHRYINDTISRSTMKIGDKNTQLFSKLYLYLGLEYDNDQLLYDKCDDFNLFKS